MPNVVELFQSVIENGIDWPGIEVTSPEPTDENSLIYQKILYLSFDQNFKNDIEIIRAGEIDGVEYTKHFAVLKDKYDLSEKHDFSLSHYIRYGSIVSFTLGDEPYLVSKVNEFGITEYFLKLTDKPKKTKIVPRKNLKRDLEIRQLRQNGNSCKQTSKLINYKYPDNKISHLEIPHLIKRLDKAF